MLPIQILTESQNMTSIRLNYNSVFLLLLSAQNKNHRIVGGTDASTGEFPYQGYFEAIRLDGYTYSCGCSLLSSKWAVTAAHCTNGIL